MHGDSPEAPTLTALLAELGRLELDLLVRDLSAAEALGTLVALREEVEAVLGRAAEARRQDRRELAALEEELGAAWPGAGALEPLRRLAEGRRGLAELDAALRPVLRLHDELQRRSSRRSPG